MGEVDMGRVSRGVVILEGDPPPAEGTTVRVEPIATPASPESPDPVAGARRMLLAWGPRAEAVAPPLPADPAAEHDHQARPRGLAPAVLGRCLSPAGGIA